MYLFSESRENHHMETTFSNVFYFFVYIFELLLANNTLFRTRSRAHVILFYFFLFKTTVLHTVFLCRAYENHGHDARNIRVNLLGFIQLGGEEGAFLLHQCESTATDKKKGMIYETGKQNELPEWKKIFDRSFPTDTFVSIETKCSAFFFGRWRKR